MSNLSLAANIQRPDDFYEDLINAHEGLSKDESDAFNARLVLVLANQIGDNATLKAALDAAALK